MSRRSRSRSKSLSPEGREVMKIMQEAQKVRGQALAQELIKKREEAKKLIKAKSITPPEQRVKKIKLTDEQKKARREKRRKRMEKRKKKKKKTNSQAEKPRSKKRTKRKRRTRKKRTKRR